MKWSIIIPVYNVEQYLSKCLDSVLRQGWKEDEYEVLLVNDGSKDRSLSICEQYAEKYHNFRIINQENAGVSAARNNGIEQSRGEFIGFIDSDDYLLDNGFCLATKPFENRKDIDVISYGSSYDFWEKKNIDNSINFDGTGFDFISKFGLPSFCWLFFYRKSFLDRYHIRFKKYVVGEDSLFTTSVLLHNPKIASTNANIYRYVVRDDSATTRRSKDFARRCVNDYLNSINDIRLEVQKSNIQSFLNVYTKFTDIINSKKMFGFSRLMTADYTKKEYKEIIKKCKESSFYPIKSFTPSLKNRLQCKLMNRTMDNYLFYRIGCVLFNKIIVPFIMPKLRVNLKK